MRWPIEVRGANFYLLDRALRAELESRAPALLARDGERLERFGAWVGGAVDEAAERADRWAPPRLEAWNAKGRLVNRIIHEPLHAAVLREVYRHGFVGLNYGPEPRPFLLTFVFGYLLAQADISVHCPATLTGAVAHVLDRHDTPGLRHRWLPGLARMDGEALTGGTWATEVDAGSDLAATATLAEPGPAGVRLTGLKWFASSPDCDLALVTARPRGAPDGAAGIGLYLMPRLAADGTMNRFRIRRLKDKLGTRGLGTGEVELDGAEALEVTPPPDGLRRMLEAFGYSRVHNAMAAAGVQRRALLEAVAHAASRRAFGDRLIAYPMVRSALLEMLVRAEASLALGLEAASAFDAALHDPAARPWLRVATALAKLQTAEWAVPAASRAIEILGGSGYVEDHVCARLLRDAQVLPVWEGAPNIQALELLRLVTGEGTGLAAWRARVEGVVSRQGGPLADIARPLGVALAACDTAVAAIHARPPEGPRRARRLATAMAEMLAAASLLEAAAEALPRGDARKALIARRFIEGCTAPAWTTAGEDEDLDRCLEPLLAGEPIEATGRLSGSGR